MEIQSKNIDAPDALNISDEIESRDAITKWWGRAKLYVDAMGKLERTVLLIHHEDEGVFSLSSVPSDIGDE